MLPLDSNSSNSTKLTYRANFRCTWATWRMDRKLDPSPYLPLIYLCHIRVSWRSNARCMQFDVICVLHVPLVQLHVALWCIVELMDKIFCTQVLNGTNSSKYPHRPPLTHGFLASFVPPIQYSCIIYPPVFGKDTFSYHPSIHPSFQSLNPIKASNIQYLNPRTTKCWFQWHV